MIVVVGLPAYADSPSGEKCAGGMAVDIAAAAVRRGGTVELVGKVGEDGAGDAVVLALGRLGIGHAALLRDPIRPTPVLTAVPAADESPELDADVDAAAGRLLPEDADQRPGLDAADVDLGLRYLTQSAVIVLTESLAAAPLRAAVEAVSFAGAKLIVVIPAGSAPPDVPADATVLEAPAEDDGSFGRLVGTFAAALDAGVEPAAAFREAVGAAGWEPAAD
jgi:sugar/nucleoside kinase (ribokinase family)